jgi:type I restriction enzyme S subunit
MAKPNQYAKKYDILVTHTDITQNAEVICNVEILLTSGDYKQIIVSLDLVKVTLPSLSNFILVLNPALRRSIPFCHASYPAHCQFLACLFFGIDKCNNM